MEKGNKQQDGGEKWKGEEGKRKEGSASVGFARGSKEEGERTSLSVQSPKKNRS
jgi:hypothetical protein